MALVLRAVKLAGIVFVVIIVGFFVLARYSTSASELTCDGHWVESGDPEILYVVLTEFNWLARLMSESGNDGFLNAQTDKLTMAYFVPTVDKIGEGSLTLYSFWQDYPRKEMIGGYRAANSEITIRFIDDLTFTGRCRPRTN